MRGLLVLLVRSVPGICCAWSGPPSFYYRLRVQNATAHEYLRVTLLQLTDFVERGMSSKAAAVVVPEQEERLIELPGQYDAPSTLFVPVAVPSTEAGEEQALPVERVYLELLQHRGFFRPAPPYALRTIGESDLRDPDEVDVIRRKERPGG